MKFKNIQLMSSTMTITIGLFIVYTSTAFSQNDTLGESKAIDSQFTRFQKAVAARDTVSLGNFYAENAISLLQNQPVRRGRNAILQRWKRAFTNPFLLRVNSEEINVSSSGQDAFQFGMFEIRSADTSSTLLASGKVMIIWRKEFSLWRIALEMDNFNATQKSATQPK